MNIKIVQGKYLNALLLLMLVSAIVHMVILIFRTLLTGDWYALNYFNILDLDLVLGNIFNTASGNILATASAAFAYLFILRFNKI